MRRLILSALAIAVVLYVPVPLGAHPSGGTKALVPVEEIEETVTVPAGTGAAEAPPAGAPAPPPAPVPVAEPETPPKLVPPAQVESQPQPGPGAATAPPPAPEPVAAPALQPKAELAQDEPSETTPEQTPNRDTPDDDLQEKDPEEFEEDFGDTVPERGDDGGRPGIAPTPGAVPVSERLPETGRELLLLSLIGTGLLLVGSTLRRLSRPRLRHL